MSPLVLLALGLGCRGEEPLPKPSPSDTREPCAERNPLRNVYFGDLHVHTGLSFDAWVQSVRTDPDDAYRFAKGEPALLPPLGADGVGTQTQQLERPLDFAAVTDHGEYLGEIELCTTPGNPAYDTETCVAYRNGDSTMIYNIGFALTFEHPFRLPEVCDAADCLEYASEVWKRIQLTAEDHYDRTSACEFTTFVAYEYTGATLLSNFHRNVIFRNATVPLLPTSYFEAPKPYQLWEALESECLEAPGSCDVLAIPHNSNWSNGRQFATLYLDAEGVEDQRRRAELRARIEPIIEVYQHKGDSECVNGLSGIIGANDELCDFEKLRGVVEPVEDCGDEPGGGAMGGFGCLSRLDFVRGILLEGLKEEERLGVNPYPLGLTASSDSHMGTPGAVEEYAYKGHHGHDEDEIEERLGRGNLTPGGVLFSPGGLTAVWAEENARDAIFDALSRKETYGTSGPRMTLRFFGGDEIDPAACSDPEWVSAAYTGGVPMGGDLPVGTASPRFVVQAARDPGTEAHPGTRLQRVQIIKGWIDADGEAHQAIYDAAGGDNDATVDLGTCEPSGGGSETLCGVWEDPDFSPSERAFYYARVVEDPSCRWSWYQCLSLPEAERPDTCSDPDVPQTIQERAWSSPIWTHP